MDALAALFANASPVERFHLVPRDLGVARLGHWAFFREGFRDRLWPEAARFVCAAVAA